MPTKRKPKEDEFFEEPSPSEIDIEDFLLEWAPQTSVVEIYRRKEDGSMPHVKRVGIDILKADLYGYLRDKFGNGKFILQFKDSGRKIVKCLTVDVEGAPAIVSGNGSSGNGTFMEQMILTLIAAQKPAPPVDMGTLLTGLGTMLAAMKPAPAVATDPAAMLAAMAATFQQLKPAEDGVDKALSIISKAKDLVPGGAEKEESWAGLVKEGVQAVASVLKPNPQGNRQVPVQPQGIPPGAQPLRRGSDGAVLLSPPAPDPAEKTSDEILQEWIGVQLAFLKTKALAGKDPDFWVDYILENQEEPGNGALLEALRRGATFQHLLAFDPEIGKNPVLSNWFQKLYETLQSELREDVDTPGAGGDAEDPPGNEKPST